MNPRIKTIATTNKRIIKFALIILLLTGTWSIAKAFQHRDEPRDVDSWQVFYGEDMIAEGSANGTGQYLGDTIVYEATKSYVTVYYTSDAVYQRERTIQILEGETLLSTQVFTESDMSVDLEEVLTRKTKSSFVTLRFRYSDKATGADYQIAEPFLLRENSLSEFFADVLVNC